MLYQFSNFDDFLKKAQEIGITSDLKALLTLDIIFYEEYEDFLVLSLTDFDSAPNRILVLSPANNLVYPVVVNMKHPLYSIPAKGKEKQRETTVTAFLVLKKSLSAYIAYYEKLNRQTDHVSNTLDVDEIEAIDRRLKKFGDAVHDFESLLIELEESTFKFVNAEMIGYDYDVLLAKATHLSDRVRGLKKEIQAVRSKCEMRFSYELNKRIEHLSNVVKTLTAVTILFMIPNIVSSHFGMNFQNTLISWNAPYGELFTVFLSAFAMLSAYLYMKKKDWI